MQGVVAAAANPAAKKAARKKKQKLRPASGIIARGEKKKRKHSSSSSSSSETDQDESGGGTGSDEDSQAGEEEETREEEMMRRLANMEKKLKQSKETAKDKSKLSEEEEKLKTRFQEQLAQVKSEANREKITFLQRVYSDCTAVELDIVSKKFKLRKDVRKRFTKLFELLMRRIAITMADDRTPGLMNYKTVIETGETERCFNKQEVDRLKKYEGVLRTGTASLPRTTRNRQGAAPVASRQREKRRTAGRVAPAKGRQQCTFAGCVAAGNINHARSACWKDPQSTKYRPQQGARGQAAEVPQ